MHISPIEAIDVASGDNVIYGILTKGLIEYDLSGGEITRRTAADYLSDVSPSAIAYDQGSSTLLIGYDNGNLDFLHNETIINLPAILQSNISGIKRINNIVCHEGRAYLATRFGIVVINLAKREVKDTYYTSNATEEIKDIAIFNDSIFALSSEGMKAGALANQFLADPAQWNIVNTIPDYSASGTYNSIVRYQNNLFIGFNHTDYSRDTVFQYSNGQFQPLISDVEVNGLSMSDNFLLVCVDGSVIVLNPDLTENQRIFQYSHGTFPEPVNALFDAGEFYIADKASGIVKAVNAFSSQRITFEGPRYNSFYRADWNGGVLAVASGGFTGTAPSFSRKGGYVRENEEWKSLSISDQAILQNTDVWDFISVAINPSNSEEIAFGTFSGIPVVITDNGSTITDTFGFSNSLLTPISTSVDWGLISDLSFDDNSNLWVANAYSDRPLKVKAENGVWYDFDLGSSVKNKRTRRIAIDNNGVKWLCMDDGGVVAFDHGESLSDISDDRHLVFSTSPTGGDLPTGSVEAIAVDFDNNIWIGTPEGMRVLYNSSGIFDASPGNYNFQKLLIEFGENVEIVLGTTHITDIEIDGANRKWIGTASSGVFLLSPDGLEVLENFTTENSPLLNNTIVDITIDDSNGEVYFVTDEGMISYRSDASQGDPSYSNVIVFPNPVHPDYFGPVTIQGIAFNSDVKITDMAGNLVYQTTSNGGTAVWNGKTLQGERVATGVYLIWTSIDDPDRKGRKVGKVVFIN